MTEEELVELSQTKSEKSWGALCDKVKAKYGGYPNDWYAKVIRSGLLLRVSKNWETV